MNLELSVSNPIAKIVKMIDNLNLLSHCKAISPLKCLYSIVVKAYNLMVVGSMPALIEVSTLRQGVYTNYASLHPGV